MKKSIFFLFILLTQISLSQVKVGKWRDHFSYNDCLAVCEGNEKIYGATSAGVFWYNLSNGEIGKISRIHGLSDIDISNIEYSETNSVLAIGYENGNIDFVFKDRILNMPQIKEKAMPGSKRINGFTFNDNLILVSTDFGIVAIDLTREEIKDTYFIGEFGASIRVNRTVILGNDIFAATERGLLKAGLYDPLLIQPQQWVKQVGFSDPLAECKDVAVFGQSIIAAEANTEIQKDIVWAINGAAWVEVGSPYNTVSHVRAEPNNLIVTSQEGISVYAFLGSIPVIYSTYGDGYWQFRPDMAIPLESGKIAIADHYLGIVLGDAGGFTPIYPNGPISNRAFSIAASSDKVIISAGGYDGAYGSMWYPFTFYTFENQQWGSYEDGDNNDATRILFNPQNANEFYIASWGRGIFRFKDNRMINHYTPSNSTLESIYPNEPYCRISGIALDKGGNLWATNAGVAKPISVRKADGTWSSFPYASIINADRFSNLFYSPSGQLWLVLPGGGGFFVLDPGTNIESTSDDLYRKFKPTDRNGNSLPSDIYSIEFDSDGYLWIGTSEGVLISYNPEEVLDASKFEIQRVKIPDVVQGLAAYLLQTETVTSITVDGGNRKWFGTSRSGVFMQSSDGSKQLLHFNTQNSPLPSNSIIDIKVHPATGEVFIATEKGVVAYHGDATKPGDSFGNVYAYPNPVKPSFDGVISIVGLVENTTVKITDISGNLVFETKSQGGQATWDGKNINGNRVSTGVYLIFCSDSKGEQTAVSKLLFIR
ncbi:MAG: T9SS C-terminal target domain-containing protein [Bacteroidales bacterium]|nr:MAG: T9SS C-terminal target domain-containing protein [Bacteroidales bacterium]